MTAVILTLVCLALASPAIRWAIKHPIAPSPRLAEVQRAHAQARQARRNAQYRRQANANRTSRPQPLQPPLGYMAQQSNQRRGR